MASASASASARRRVDDSPPSRPSPKRGHFNEEEDEEDDNGAEASTPVASTISSVMPRAQRDSGAGSDGDSDVEDTTHSSSSVESKMLMKVLNRLANTLDGLAAKKRKNDKKKAPTMVLPTRAESQSRLLGHVAVMFSCVGDFQKRFCRTDATFVTRFIKQQVAPYLIQDKIQFKPNSEEMSGPVLY